MVDYDRLTPEYVCHRRIHSGVLEILRARSGTARESKVLEVGCGTGNYIRALQELTGCTCLGIDPSEQMLAEARQRSSGIEFRTGRAESLGFPDEMFDFVFSVDVVHHMSKWQAYLGEARRVLKPAGKVCTVTDSEWHIRHRRPLVDYFPEIVDIELARYPRIEKLREAMAQMGFADIEEDMLKWRYRVTDIRPYKDKAFSCLHLISDEAFQKGIAQMEKDLLVAPLEGEGGYVLLWGTRGGPRE